MREDDLRYCEDVLRRSRSSFRLAIRWLPPEPRRAMVALYAFARVVDDLVDEEPDREEARRGIGWWREVVSRLPGDPAPHPVARALAHAMREQGLPRESLHLLLEGMEQDLEGPRIETFGDLCLYAHRVAGSVGLATLAVSGLRGPWVRRHAVLAGAFVQIVNVIRDVAEDHSRGRVYLPRQDLALEGLDPGNVLDPSRREALSRVLRRTARRARELDAMAEAAIPPDRRRDMAFPNTLRALYRELLQRLEDRGFPVHEGPTRPGILRSIRVGLREGMGLSGPRFGRRGSGG